MTAMHLSFCPVEHPTPLTLSRAGDVLTVNGGAFDFGPLADGAILPASAIGSPWFTGPARRTGGEIFLELRLPHAADAPAATRFPAPITLTADGPVVLPPYATETE